MDDMTKEYLLLFNTITDALETLDELRERLIKAQQKAEDLYIERGASDDDDWDEADEAPEAEGASDDVV